jgi:hypothetical protein
VRARRAFSAHRRALPAIALTPGHDDPDGDRQRLRVRSGLRAASSRRSGGRATSPWRFRRAARRRNVLAGLQCARSRGLKTVAFTGRQRAGPIGRGRDVHVNVPHDVTPRVQELHRTLDPRGL